MDELDADPVPLPLRDIVVERDLRFFERVSEHERTEDGHVANERLPSAAFCPLEQFREWRAEAMPHLFDGIDVQPERVGKRLLGEAGIDANAKLTERQLQQRE